MIVIDRLSVWQQLRDMMKTFCYCFKLIIFLIFSSFQIVLTFGVVSFHFYRQHFNRSLPSIVFPELIPDLLYVIIFVAFTFP